MSRFPIILSAPSGAGKTTIARRLVQRRPDLGYSVSCTTRLPRSGEVDARDYHFVSVGEFTTKRDRGEFAEWAEVHGKLYGTLRREVEKVQQAGQHVVMDIDVQGATQFKQAFPESVLIFLLPPSADVLLTRLTERRTDDRNSVIRRLQAAREELKAIGMYHYVVVNDDLEKAIDAVSSIIDAEGARHDRIQELDEQVGRIIAGLQQRIDGLSAG
jgi:guanylate kinase